MSAVVCFLSFLGCQKKPPIEDLPWVSIEGGDFLRGITLEELKLLIKDPHFPKPALDVVQREIPQEIVHIDDFSILKTEVTVAQYKKCINAGICRKPPKDAWCSSNQEDSDSLPVSCVNQDDAKKFCEWVGGRLPTELEWEYAARSRGKAFRHPWGNAPEWPTCEYAIIDDKNTNCGKKKLWPVCSKPRGNTEQGVCDMAGNAWEWTATSAHPYSGYEEIPKELLPLPENNVDQEDCIIIRGGGPRSLKDYRTTLRICHYKDFKYGGLSIRCAKD